MFPSFLPTYTKKKKSFLKQMISLTKCKLPGNISLQTSNLYSLNIVRNLMAKITHSKCLIFNEHMISAFLGSKKTRILYLKVNNIKSIMKSRMILFTQKVNINLLLASKFLLKVNPSMEKD